jgi:hypothetical protein
MSDTPSPVAADAVTLLRSIDATLKELLALSKQKRAAAPAPAAASSASTPAIAPDSDLDGPHGDPVIKSKDPRDWSGPSMLGKKFSECPPDYLGLLAARYEFFNTQPDVDAKKRRYNEIDAARARGWKKRLLEGWQPPAAKANPWGQTDSAWKDGDAF